MEGKAKVENGNRIDRVIRREEAAELLGNSRAHAHQDEPAEHQDKSARCRLPRERD